MFLFEIVTLLLPANHNTLEKSRGFTCLKRDVPATQARPLAESSKLKAESGLDETLSFELRFYRCHKRLSSFLRQKIWQ